MEIKIELAQAFCTLNNARLIRCMENSFAYMNQYGMFVITYDEVIDMYKEVKQNA